MDVIRYHKRINSGLCPFCGKESLATGMKIGSSCYSKHKIRNAIYTERTKQYNKEYNRKYTSKLRKIVYDSYGSKCSCCGEENDSFLTLDHIDGGGNKFRASSKYPTGCNFYRYLIKNKFPKDIQILCANCHLAKTRFGKCTYH